MNVYGMHYANFMQIQWDHINDYDDILPKRAKTCNAMCIFSILIGILCVVVVQDCESGF